MFEIPVTHPTKLPLSLPVEIGEKELLKKTWFSKKKKKNMW